MLQMNTNCFTIVELEQGTTKWLEWRHGGIGASDAPTIMGENYFKSFQQLLKEKREPPNEPHKNLAMIRGTQLEPVARKRYILKKGIDVSPVCLQSTQQNWLRASLDGFAINHKIVVEIKCGESAYKNSVKNQTVPKNYYGQVQHILAVTGFETLDFFCYWPGCPELLFTVERNEQYIDLLLEKEFEFWNFVNKQV